MGAGMSTGLPGRYLVPNYGITESASGRKGNRGTDHENASDVGTLTAALLAGRALYEKEGISLDGSVRLVPRDATCEVSLNSHSTEAEEAIQLDQSRPLHGWRPDYDPCNGSGRPLEQLTTHVRTASQ